MVSLVLLIVNSFLSKWTVGREDVYSSRVPEQMIDGHKLCLAFCASDFADWETSHCVAVRRLAWCKVQSLTLYYMNDIKYQIKLKINQMTYYHIKNH